jgi:hypothetical protein
MSPTFHRGLVLDPVLTVGPGHPVFACVGVHGCGCLVLDVEQHADWHLRYARPPVIPPQRPVVEAGSGPGG